MNSFSYLEYKNILSKFKGNIVDYSEVNGLEEYTCLRHDVEFDIDRALEMAKIDAEFGVKSSFLFQVRSGAYNILSISNRKKIYEIIELDCNVGLHFYVSHIQEGAWDVLKQELSLQVDIFEAALDIKCDRFSYHRPPKWVLEDRSDDLLGIINTYGDSFFEYSPNPQSIKYMADSRHRFDYGHPLDTHDYKKFQLLFHPDEWSIEGGDEVNNFRNLEKEHLEKFYVTLNCETKNYAGNKEIK